MTKNECYELGRITKTHGIKGEVNIWLDVDFPDEYEDLESVFVDIKGELVPYFVQKILIRPNQTIVQFEDVDTFEKAEALLGASLYLPLDVLPDLEKDQFYYHEIVGFQVVDKKLGVLGTVNTVYSMQVQDLVSMDYQSKEVLIPVSDSIVLSADKAQKILNVDLPDGLIDVYLSE
ncbi:16S rRNA processing protein RimM [Pseudarcicella hirudinis]|uniref:Ribosome maturation factor RimM n=1 Tax=Pseudarcicella hirudinis TaxID=1079859 RepID=A0A1I5SSB3_9BACT|nr:ribosome maturation factor RimM [Pseudarcicella hirudinis]SFP73146.1 16S rRNA processing protein RimM [Pseudarcicella hirudinis]